jgi:hypothetical protein
VKLDLRPHHIKCADCAFVANTFSQLTVHWRKAWRSPRRFGKHWKPRATAA